jgi:hypothetical protein
MIVPIQTDEPFQWPTPDPVHCARCRGEDPDAGRDQIDLLGWLGHEVKHTMPSLISELPL